jgi:large subunit ribosomal protein L28
MSRVCELTGKRPTTGNLVSHSNIKTRTRWLPNLVRKRYLIPELGQVLTLRLSTAAVKTIDKVGGITPAILKAKDDVLSEQLLRIKNKVVKQRKQGSSK